MGCSAIVQRLVGPGRGRLREHHTRVPSCKRIRQFANTGESDNVCFLSFMPRGDLAVPQLVFTTTAHVSYLEIKTNAEMVTAPAYDQGDGPKRHQDALREHHRYRAQPVDIFRVETSITKHLLP